MNDRHATLLAAVQSVAWHQTIELPGGIVTPGHFDTPRLLEHLPLPADLSGRRCLDVATADGFWAFEMERRGATDVVAIDVASPRDMDIPIMERNRTIESSHPLDAGFRIARDALGSGVEYEARSVYDLAGLDRQFDLVVVGGLLTHLRDPVGALECVRSVCARDVIAFDAMSRSLLLRRSPTAAVVGRDGPFWWMPNPAAHARWYEAAAFTVTAQSRRPFFAPLGAGHASPSPLRSIQPRTIIRRSFDRRGVLFSWLTATPNRQP